MSSMQPTGSTTTFESVNGGDYEFWAAVSSRSPWLGGQPRVVEVDVDGTPVPGVLLLEGQYEDGGNHSMLTVRTPEGTVLRVSRYDTVAVGGDTQSSLSALSGGVSFVVVEDGPWADLLSRAATAMHERSKVDAELRRQEAEDAGCLKDPASPCEIQPPSTPAPTTTLLGNPDDRTAPPAVATDTPESRELPTTTSPAG